MVINSASIAHATSWVPNARECERVFVNGPRTLIWCVADDDDGLRLKECVSRYCVQVVPYAWMWNTILAKLTKQFGASYCTGRKLYAPLMPYAISANSATLTHVHCRKSLPVLTVNDSKLRVIKATCRKINRDICGRTFRGNAKIKITETDFVCNRLIQHTLCTNYLPQSRRVREHTHLMDVDAHVCPHCGRLLRVKRAIS